ncbi:helix-turn-helix domain-containing protein [Nocardiopsis alba]|uniref:helix-turn-helix domain-containing protein n=1 Tax=Nocardiopsis alba TaxID=53437 RepID=UPI00366D4613
MQRSENGEEPHFARLLRRYRERIGFTQQQLADFSTVSVRAIRNLEQGRARNPRKDTVRLIADALRLQERDRSRLEQAAGRGGTEEELRVAFETAPAPRLIPRGEMIGRDAEISALADTLCVRDQRVVTVTGFPKVGKSRLALAAAERAHALHGYPVLWANRGGTAPSWCVVEPADGMTALVQRAVDELLVRGHGATGPHRGITDLSAVVKDHRAVLVLDGLPPNALNAARVGRLLGDCPGLRLLITSTRPQGIPVERAFHLEPLVLPTELDGRSGADLGAVPAVRIFVRHMWALRPDDDILDEYAVEIARICWLLDGLPGVLEAASTWLSVYDPPALLELVEQDPFTPLSPLFGGPEFPSEREALLSMLDDLEPMEAEVLRALCSTERAVSVDQLVLMCALPLVECGRLVRGLGMRGLIRRGRRSSIPVFTPLNLVRAMCARQGGTRSFLYEEVATN